MLVGMDAAVAATAAEEATAVECPRLLEWSTAERRRREAAAAAAAAEEGSAARDSFLEDKEGEGSWKPAASPAPSTLGSRHSDRTQIGKAVGFFGKSVCPRVCVYLYRTVSKYLFHQISELLEGQSIHPTLPYLTSPPIARYELAKPSILQKQLVCMVGFYGVAARNHVQHLELVLGIGSDGHFGTRVAFWGTSREIGLAVL
jgi:hypothetical protein